MSSTEYNPLHFSGKTKELFTSGPAASPGCAHRQPGARRSLGPAGSTFHSRHGAGPTSLPWESSYREGQSALGHGMGMAVLSPEYLQPQLCPWGGSWKCGRDTQPGRPGWWGGGWPWAGAPAGAASSLSRGWLMGWSPRHPSAPSWRAESMTRSGAGAVPSQAGWERPCTPPHLLPLLG